MRVTPYLVMLTVASVTGSVLFAAESNRQAQSNVMAMKPATEVDKDKPAPEATDEKSAKPDAAKPGADKSAAGKSEATRAEAAEKPEKAADADDAAADKPAEKSAAAKGAKSDADRASTPQRFVPSEEVRADFDVSFPVDI